MTCDKEFLDVCEFLLGGTVVIDNIDNAIAISKKYKNAIKLVTLTGELFNVGGALSGGSFYKQASLFGRENEIVALTKEIPAFVCPYIHKKFLSLYLPFFFNRMGPWKCSDTSTLKRYIAVN